MTRLQRLGLWALSTVWGALFFTVAFWLTFPSTAAARWAAWQVDQGSDGAWALQVAGVRPWWGAGLQATGVELFARDAQPPRRRVAPNEDGLQPERGPARSVLKLERAAARLRLFSLLRGRLGATVSADLYGGTLEGFVARDQGGLLLDVLAKDLDLAQYPMDGDTFQADLAGKLRIKAESLYLDQTDPKNSRGMLRFEMDGLQMTGASVMGLTLGDATFTEAVLRFDLSDGKARVKKGSFVSDLVQVQVNGDVNLANPVGRSRLRLDLDVQLGEELDKLAALAPNLKESRDADGVYHFTCTGTLDRPLCREVNQKRASRRTAAVEGLGGEDVLDPGAEVDAADAEERKRQREERLEERRRRLRERRDARLRDQGRPPAPDGPLPGPGEEGEDGVLPPRIPLDEDPDLDLERVPLEDYEDEGPPGLQEELGYME